MMLSSAMDIRTSQLCTHAHGWMDWDYFVCCGDSGFYLQMERENLIKLIEMDSSILLYF